MSRTDCGSCRGSGIAYVLLVLRQRARLSAAYLPARCPCGAGEHSPWVPELRDLRERLARPAALERWPGLVDVLELGRPWGDRWVAALAQVLPDGARVEAWHREHAWRVVQEARRPMSVEEVREMPRIEVAERAAEVGW